MIDSDAPVPNIRQITRRRLVGRTLLTYQRVGSTQDVAMGLIAQKPEEGTAVLANVQTNARGRHGRQWVAVPGASVNLSVILYPTTDTVMKVNMAAPVAVVKAIQRVTKLRATIKWPNDVRLRGLKVCGILVENQVPEQGSAISVVGIGVNVDFEPKEYPALANYAIGLVQAYGHAVSVAEIAEAILDELDELYGSHGVVSGVFEKWRGLLDTLGTKVEVRWGESVERGLAVDVDKDGSLMVRRSDGSIVTLQAGDVTLQL